MRILVLVLTLMLAVLNYPLWLSEGHGFQKVWLLRDAIATQRTENATLDERNKTLEAEVKDLKGGLAAIEERARLEMGMIRRDKTFFHILEGNDLPKPAPKPGTQKATAQKPAGQQAGGRSRVAKAKVQQQPVRKSPVAPAAAAKVSARPRFAATPARPAVAKQAIQPPAAGPAARKPDLPKTLAITQPQGQRSKPHD